MITKGLRILDIENEKCVPLSKILTTIKADNQFYWALLWLDATPLKGEGKDLVELQKKINSSGKGMICTFESLLAISNKMFQEISITIIACSSKEDIRRYKEDQEMYETCDIVIEMIDGGFWEVFSKKTYFIERLAEKFQDVEFLTSGSQNS